MSNLIQITILAYIGARITTAIHIKIAEWHAKSKEY